MKSPVQNSDPTFLNLFLEIIQKTYIWMQKSTNEKYHDEYGVVNINDKQIHRW